MERVKVLSAAVALREFTVDELAAFSGVKPTSVRSVLNRNPEVVHRLGPAGAGRRGRPTTKWALVDSSTSRKLISELDALSGIEARPPLSSDDRREVAVSVAEEALSQVIGEADPAIQQEIFSSAQSSLNIADGQHQLVTDEPWWQDDASSFAVRARGVNALATLATTPRGEMSNDLLTKTAVDVASAMAEVGDRGDAAYFAPLSQTLAAHGSFAPLLAIGQNEPPSRVSEHWTELEVSGLDLDTERVLTQSWAAPLAHVSASMPMLLASVGHEVTARTLVIALLQKIRTIPRPTLVLGDVGEKELMRTSLRLGASFVEVENWPSAGDRQLAIDAVAGAIDRHAAR